MSPTDLVYLAVVVLIAGALIAWAYRGAGPKR